MISVMRSTAEDVRVSCSELPRNRVVLVPKPLLMLTPPLRSRDLPGCRIKGGDGDVVPR